MGTTFIIYTTTSKAFYLGGEKYEFSSFFSVSFVLLHSPLPLVTSLLHPFPPFTFSSCHSFPSTSSSQILTIQPNLPVQSDESNIVTDASPSVEIRVDDNVSWAKVLVGVGAYIAFTVRGRL